MDGLVSGILTDVDSTKTIYVTTISFASCLIHCARFRSLDPSDMPGIGLTTARASSYPWGPDRIDFCRSPSPVFVQPNHLMSPEASGIAQMTPPSASSFVPSCISCALELNRSKFLCLIARRRPTLVLSSIRTLGLEVGPFGPWSRLPQAIPSVGPLLNSQETHFRAVQCAIWLPGRQSQYRTRGLIPFTRHAPRSRILILLAFCPAIGNKSFNFVNRPRRSSLRPRSATTRALLGLWPKDDE